MNFENTNPAREPGPNEAGLLSIGTMVLWMFCLVVGVVGQVIPYAARTPPARPPPTPVQAEIIHVDLTKMISPTAVAPPAPPNHSTPPEESSLPAPPSAPTAVAAPSPVMAFAVPVAGPVRIVAANQAIARPIAHPRPAVNPVASGASNQPTHLILGQGEGRQPAPEYPFEAVRQGEQGTVVVRFTVSETGSVLTADAVVPCPYPLLNQAAVQAIRDTWHFVNGPVRSYEVSIQFQLQPR